MVQRQAVGPNGLKHRIGQTRQITKEDNFTHLLKMGFLQLLKR